MMSLKLQILICVFTATDTEEGAAAVRQLTNLRSLAVWEGNDVDDEPPSWPKGLASHTQLQEVTLAHFDLVSSIDTCSGHFPFSRFSCN